MTALLHFLSEKVFSKICMFGMPIKNHNGSQVVSGKLLPVSTYTDSQGSRSYVKISLPDTFQKCTAMLICPAGDETC